MNAIAWIFALVCFGLGLVLVLGVTRGSLATADDDPEQYLRSLDDEWGSTDEFDQLLSESFFTRVLRPFGSRMAGGLSGLLPGNYRDTVHRKLVMAGLQRNMRAEELLVLQLLAMGGMTVAGIAYVVFMQPSTQIALVALLGAPAAGVALPTAWLNRKVEERQEALLKALPDSLDLLAISVEAGMGFEGAIGVVADQYDTPLAVEFSRTLKEMELGLPRREALQNLKKRTEVPELSNFILALVQADALGMPIGRVLKTQADELRMKRRQWAREKAAQLPVKMMLPLVLFIFPAVLIVSIGPAIATTIGAF